MPCSSRLCALRGLLAAALLGLSSGAVAQTSPQQGDSARAGPTAAVVADRDRSSSLLDAPIDPDTYVLGPGDQVEISIFGALSRSIPAVVSPSGDLVITEVGIVQAGGASLAEAERRVRSAVLRLYQNVGVHLTLTSVRSFKIFLVGDVRLPGVRFASATTRVSEVLSEGLELNDSSYLHRSVQVRRGNQQPKPIDLVRFRLTGNLESNPMLREGDVVIVPVVRERVYVYGRVAYPGEYEFRQGESLAQLLALSNGGGGFSSDASDTVRVSRSLGSDRQEQFSFSQQQALGRSGMQFVLRPSDAVYVARDNSVANPRFVRIDGEVARPGMYPIEPGVTTVRDIVDVAGGFQPDASLAQATLVRSAALEDTSRLAGLRSVPPELLSSRERRLLMASDRTGNQGVIIDFQKLFLEGADVFDQVLEAGDVLMVPKTHDDITILGAVVRPGIVHFEPGRKLRYFVGLAGGYTKKADRDGVTVVHANASTRLDASEVVELRAGDLIVVPYQEKRDYLQYLQTTSAVVTTITGLVLTFVALIR